MRRCTFFPSHHSASAAMRAQFLPVSLPMASIRGIRTANQYSPLHTFNNMIGNSSAAQNVNSDLSFGEFKQLVTNPGPLRVVFSDDYLDWYYRGFKQRLAFEQSKQSAAAKSLGSSSHSPEQILFGNSEENNKKGSNNANIMDDDTLGFSSQPLRPPSSALRQVGEQVMERSQERIDRASVQHGLFDLFERCPQFPQVHIDKALDEHIPLLFEEFIFRNEVSAADVWRRALIARALLLANKKSYPSSFNYIFDELESCVFAKPKGLSTSAATAAVAADGSKQEGASASSSSSSPSVAQELLDDSSLKKYPTLALARYYEYLVKRYHVNNSVEAHVLLKCHLLPDAETLLFSNPPPEDERDPSKVNGGPDWKQAVALPLPPIDELFEPGNLPLARALLFAEFNCHVTAHDPFAKFSNAQSIVSRPTQSETREEFEKASHISKFQHRRHHVLPTIVQYTLTSIDMRMREVNRLARQNEDGDRQWTGSSKTLDRSDRGDGTIGSANFNHRAVRAELRDFANRRVVAGLKQYKAGREMTERPTLLSGEESARFGTDGGDLTATTSMMTLKSYGYLKVSYPRFIATVESDRHVSLILSMLSNLLSSSSTTASGFSQQDSTLATGNQLGARVQKLVYDYAKQLLRLAQEYHKPETRQVQLKAAKICGALLDGAVVDALEFLKNSSQQQQKQNSSSSLVFGDSASGILSERFTPFADRALNEYGFPTEAKYDDYARWVYIEDDSSFANQRKK